jgi:hypothetical protein
MATVANLHDYRLSFDDEKRIDFEARGIARALALAHSLIGTGRSAILYEDGAAVGRVSAKGLSLYPDYCRPV